MTAPPHPACGHPLPRRGRAGGGGVRVNPAAGNWSTVSNAVALAAVQLTNVANSAFFRLQGSGGGVPSPGLSSYFGQLVLFYATNGYALQSATQPAAPDWTSASSGGKAFLAWQVTNATPGAVFRLH